MPVCIHGWGSDGVNPSGCHECDIMGRERDNEDLMRLRNDLIEALDLLGDSMPQHANSEDRAAWWGRWEALLKKHARTSVRKAQ